MFIVIMLIATLIPSVLWAAQAISEPSSLEEVGQLVPMFFSLAQEGKWLMVGALATLVIVFALKKYFFTKISNSALPWVSIAVGILSAIAISLLSGASLKEAAMALMAGPTASMIWTLLAKHLFKTEAK